MNYYNFAGLGVTKTYTNKHPLAPKWPFRLLICGPSGCGKTNILMKLIYEMIHFDILFVYAKDLGEPLYENLQSFYDDIHKKIEKKKKKRIEIAFFSSSKEDNIDELDPNYQNLIIFDDFVTEKDQKSIEDLFIRGRKKNASVIYLSQSYFKTPKNIRLQCNYFAFFEIPNKREMNQIQIDHTTDIDKSTFERYYRYATKTPYRFLFIDKRDKNYRKRFDEYLS